jgi:hypothetical protein
LGVSITQSSWSVEDTAVELDASNSFLTFGAGLTWSNNEDMVLDASLTFGTAGGDITFGTDKVEWDSSTAFDIAARLFYDWTDDVTVVPMAEFATSDYALKQTTTPPSDIPTPNGNKITDFMIGVGMNMDVNEDNMLVFALEYMHRSWEYTNPDTTAGAFDKSTWTYLPTVRLALETQQTDHITTRIGAAKYLVSYKEEANDGEEYKETPGVPTGIGGGNVPNFEWFLGCGFNIAEWTIDLELASETPFNLGYWLTGYSNYDTAGGPVSHISAVWNY